MQQCTQCELEAPTRRIPWRPKEQFCSSCWQAVYNTDMAELRRIFQAAKANPTLKEGNGDVHSGSSV